MTPATIPGRAHAGVGARRNVDRVPLIAVEQHVVGAVGVNVDQAGSDDRSGRRDEVARTVIGEQPRDAAVLDSDPAVNGRSVAARNLRGTENDRRFRTRPPHFASLKRAPWRSFRDQCRRSNRSIRERRRSAPPVDGMAPAKRSCSARSRSVRRRRSICSSAWVTSVARNASSSFQAAALTRRHREDPLRPYSPLSQISVGKRYDMTPVVRGFVVGDGVDEGHWFA